MKIKLTHILVFLLLMVALLGIYLWTISLDPDNPKNIFVEKVQESINYKFGLITSIGGFGDFSYDDMQYKGVIKVRKKLEIDFVYRTPNSLKEIDSLLIDFIENKKCNVIFLGSYNFLPFTLKYSKLYPNVKFVQIDNILEKYPANVASINFKHNEGAFLAGVLAGKFSKRKYIGAIGGIDIPIINNFIEGFIHGVTFIDPNKKVILRYIKDKEDSLNNPWQNTFLAKSIAEKMIKKYNVDVIFGVAARSNLGIFELARDSIIYAIGVDDDQDHIYPGRILTSMMKRVDRAIFLMVENIISHKFMNKNYYLGLKEECISLSPMQYTRKIIGKETIMLIDSLKRKIIKDKDFITKHIKG